MSYLISNHHSKLQLQVKTNQSNYSSLKLNTYVNYDHSTIIETLSPSYDDGVLTYTILSSNYNLNDLITKFELVLDGTTHLWETNEGVKWLIDGEEWADNGGTDTFHTASKTFNWEESGTHTVEAVFVGNDALEHDATGKCAVLIEQPKAEEVPEYANDGKYRISFVNPQKVTSMSYNDGTKMEYLLTKGGKPVKQSRNIEIITPTTIYSETLNPKTGKAYIKNDRNWKAGKYTIGAFYQDERNPKVITKCSKKITIDKGTPVFTDNFEGGTFIPESKYKLRLTFQNEPLVNRKITLYVNNKATTLTTNKGGVIYYPFKKTGTFVLKAVFKGSKNLKKIELMRTITVVKANG